jgi:hypothetical protein
MLRAHRNAIATLDKYAITMSNVAHLLSASRDSFAIVNTDADLRVVSASTINGAELPDVGAIQTALEAYHASKLKIRNAWQAVPDEFKGGLQKPPFEIRMVG